MSIRQWPVAQRPREKLLKRGAVSLSDSELLAIFLRTGLPGINAVNLAGQLLIRFGGLKAMLEADLDEFCRAPGMGPAKFAQLQAVMELANRYLQQQLERQQVITSPVATRQFLLSSLAHKTQEVFACVFLDSQHRVIAFEELFSGTIDGASVYPRVVVQRTLHHNAAALILAHNHPSGIAEPSQADRRITQRLSDAVALIDVRILDHMVIASGRVISFAERGLL